MIERSNPDGSFDREMPLKEVCDELHGHSHAVDHEMTVLRGAARVTVCEPDDRRVSVGEPVELRPGDPPFLVKAEMWHNWKALEPDTLVRCHFPNGEYADFAAKE